MEERAARRLARYIGTESYRRLGNGDPESGRLFRRARAAFWYLLCAAVFFAVGFSFAFF